MRIKQPMSQKWHILWGVIGIAFLVAIYCYLCYVQKSNNPQDTRIPNLAQFKEGFVEITRYRQSELAAMLNPDAPVEPPWLLEDFKATYGRLFKAMVWGSFLAFFVGVLMGCFEIIEALFGWTLSFLAKVPPTSLLAVFLVLGNIMQWDQGTMFIVLVGFGIMPTLTQSIFLASKNDPHEDEIDKVYSLGASNLEAVWDIVVQKIFPKVIDGVRLTIGPAMVYLIAAEYSLGHVGFGYTIRFCGRLGEMNVVYIYIAILGTTGLLLDQGLILLRKVLCPWYGKGGWKSPYRDVVVKIMKWMLIGVVLLAFTYKVWGWINA